MVWYVTKINIDSGMEGVQRVLSTPTLQGAKCVSIFFSCDFKNYMIWGWEN